METSEEGPRQEEPKEEEPKQEEPKQEEPKPAPTVEEGSEERMEENVDDSEAVNAEQSEVNPPTNDIPEGAVSTVNAGNTENNDNQDIPETAQDETDVPGDPKPPENTMDISSPVTSKEKAESPKQSKSSSPKSRTKLPPINGALPMKYPPIGIGDSVYHPTATPRRQMRPFGLRPTNLSSFGGSQSTDSHHNLQPDVNSLGGQNGRYEDSLADSGFASGSVYPAPVLFTNQGDEMDDSLDVVDLPFQSQKFKSSTVMKMVTVPRRHQDMFGSSKDRFYNKNRPMAYHTGRYNYLESLTEKLDRSPSQLSQRDRMLLETAHLEKLRDIRKELGSSAPHRMALDLAMGGSKVEFFDRVDIPAELRELKNVALPSHARDLYVGRGIALPQGHALNKPRRLDPIVKNFLT